MAYTIKELKKYFFQILTAYLLTPSFAFSEEIIYRNSLPVYPHNDTMTLEEQCGKENNLQHVALYKENLNISKDYVNRYESLTVHFQWHSIDEISQKYPDFNPGTVGGAHWCTGTLISEKLVLTAGHCFDIQKDGGWITPWKKNKNGSVDYLKPKLLAKLQQVHFGYQLDTNANGKTPITYEIKELLDWRGWKENGIDYAIIELVPKNDILPHSNPINFVKQDPIEGHLAVIIQHPNKVYKIVGGEERIIDDKSCDKLKRNCAYKMIGTGKITDVTPLAFYYQTDTYGGSSGAGIRNEAGELIGVHSGGGCYQSGEGANVGVPLKEITKVSPLVP